MTADSLTALVRAAAHLHVSAEVDPALLDALARLVSPPPATRTTMRPWRESTALPRAIAQPTPTDRPERSRAQPRASTADRTSVGLETHRSQPAEGRLVSHPSTLQRLAERADLAAPQRGHADARHAPERRLAEAGGQAAPLESLFAPGRVRAIVRELATLSSHSGPPDIDAAVRMVASAETFERLPRRRRSALAHSVQLLFDAGPAMLPFATDQQQFAATATRLLGRDRVRIADFVVNPLQGVRAQSQVRWEELRWPVRRSAVMVVSDLGIGGRGGRGAEASLQADDWGRFAAETRRRGLRSVVLIPYARERWPAVAAAFDTALTWDLDTGVQALRRLAHKRRKA